MYSIDKLLKTGRWCLKHRLTVICKLLRIFQRIFYNCDIPFSARIDDTVHFNHNGIGVVVNPQTVIGAGCDIQHGVTFGILYNGNHNIFGRGGAPRLGKCVFVGCKATLLGPISVGDNARIGAGALVIENVPANCTAVGVPARIIHN